MRSSSIKNGILKYFNRRPARVRRAFTFSELYSELESFSKQAIRNRVYTLIDDGKIERVPKSEVLKKDKRKGVTAYFRLKTRS